MQIEINDEVLTGKLERIARQDGVSVEQVAVDLINSALDDDAAAIKALEDFLQPRIDRARRGKTVDTTVEEIFSQVRAELNAS